MLYPKFKVSKINQDECKKACDYIEQNWNYKVTKDLLEYLEASMLHFTDGDYSLKDYDPDNPYSYDSVEIDICIKNMLSKNPLVKRISRNQLFYRVLDEYDIHVDSMKNQILVDSIKQTDLIDNYLDEINSEDYVKVNNRYYETTHDYKIALN